MKKTYDELLEEIRLTNLAKQVREESDKLYAIKLVEKVVFGMVGLILTIIVGLIIRGIMK